jgi:DNA-binding SARP family transcriptional activator
MPAGLQGATPVPQLAKLTRPRLHRVLPRERLFARLDACRTSPLIWIAGPPGAGKTALAASWLDARRTGGIWYQLDSGDSDLAAFFHYLDRVAPRGTRRQAPLPTFTTAHQMDPAGFARLYFRALFERLKAPAVVVFDNYHELPPAAPLHGLLETIVREIPDGITLLVTSRGDPPAQCAGLRANDRLALLDWDALRLTFDETCGIASLRRNLDEASLRALHAQADGWPVGLVLTLEQAGRHAAGAELPRPDNREILFGYFAGQIFDDLPENTRSQLAQLALLPRATAEQAAALTGDANAGAVLEELYHRRLFVERHADAYQFHDLFRSFLLGQLEAAADAECVAAVRRRAAAILADAGQPEAAFDCAAGGGDWADTTSLLLRFAPSLFEQGRIATLRTWIEAIPTALVQASAQLMFWQGISLISHPLQARPVFEAAYERFGDDTIGRILCCGAILSTHYLEFGQGAFDRWLDRLLSLLASNPEFPAPAADLRVHAGLLFALGYQRPRADLVEACLFRMQRLLLSPDIPLYARVDATTMMLAHHQMTGDFDEGERIVAMVSPWIADASLTPNHRAMWMLQLGHFRSKQGRDAEAEQLFDEAVRIADANALVLPPLRIYSHLGRTAIALCAGNPEAADAARTQAAARWTFARPLDLALDACFRTWIAIHRGEHGQALIFARELCERMDQVGPVWLRCMARLQLAIAELECDKDADVVILFEQARQLLTGTCLARLGGAVDAVEAWMHLQRGDAAAARSLIQRCVNGQDVLHGQFLLRLHPRLLTDVYAAALTLGISEGEVRRAIREYGLRAPAADIPGWPWPLEVRMLGRFEVLRDGQPLVFSRKAPKKTLALLKAMVALGGRAVSEHRLLDALWAGEEGDAAERALDSTLLRLRGLLGDPAAIVQQGGKLSFNQERVWVDVFAFEQAIVSADDRRNTPLEDACLSRAIELYQGSFLAEDGGEAWPVATRERLRGRFIHALSRRAEHLEAHEDYEAAVSVYLRGLDADPMMEAFYQGLMRCYQRLGRRSEGISAYQRLRQVLSVTLGLTPSPSSEKLFQALRTQAPT